MTTTYLHVVVVDEHLGRPIECVLEGLLLALEGVQLDAAVGDVEAEDDVAHQGEGTQDAQEGVRAALERRQRVMNFSFMRWLRKAQQIMLNLCPNHPI